MENMTSTSQPEIAVFDAYGTLFDVHSTVARLADRMAPDATRISELWRQKQLEYAWPRSAMQRYADFWQVTEDALDYVLASPSQRASACGGIVKPRCCIQYSTFMAQCLAPSSLPVTRNPPTRP
jgi:hypothetical protein